MVKLGVVAIGRNEGDRLRRCLESLSGRAATIVYVDSGSSDGSVALAQSRGVEVVALDLSIPFTAARARNEGFARLLQVNPAVELVQFVDGDCEIAADWLERGQRELEFRPTVGVVCGRRRERFPTATIYNQLCDMEWNTPIGEAEACGGDALMRVAALQQVGGYRASLIAGEEPELCVRLRAAGWKIQRLDAEMTLHDAAMTQFGQWWKRNARAGHAFAEVSWLHRGSPYGIWRRETRSNWIWGLIVPVLALLLALPTAGLSLLAFLLYPVLAFRVFQYRRKQFGDPPAQAVPYAVFCVLGKFAQASGQVRYHKNRLLARESTLIEYKTAAASPVPSRNGEAHSMKVAYLVNQYPHVSHSFIRREIAALEAQGVSVERFSVRPPPTELVDAADQAEQQRTQVLLANGILGLIVPTLTALGQQPLHWFRALWLTIKIGWRSERGVLRHLVYLAEACTLLGKLRACGAQHLHAHFGTNSATVALLTRILGGPPYSFTVHGPEEFDHPEELSLGKKIEHAAAVVAISDFGRSQLFRWCSYAHWPKIHVVHCGVDASFLAAGPQPPVDTHQLVCVGRLAEQKGQLLILDALAQLAADGVAFQMVLAGDGPMRGVIEQRIAQLGLTDRVRITGWISNATVRQEILAARVMVLPSFAEGLPVVLMEALALGRPVVTTYVAGIPELVQDGVNGWLVPAGSVPALSAALRAALSAPVDRLAAMGEAGAKAAAAMHDVNTEAAKLAALFQRNSPLGAGESEPALVRS